MFSPPKYYIPIREISALLSVCLKLKKFQVLQIIINDHNDKGATIRLVVSEYTCMFIIRLLIIIKYLILHELFSSNFLKEIKTTLVKDALDIFRI